MQADLEMEHGIGRLTIRGPGANSLTHPVFVDTRQLRRLLADDSLRALVVTGHGRHFSSGADTATLEKDLEDPDALARSLEKARAILDALSLAPVPTVAAIRGSCLGAGLEIALCCHTRIASENAVLGFPESSLGIVPGLGGMTRAAGVGHRGALVSLLLSGEMIPAVDAMEIGLVDMVVPTKDLEERARSHIETLLGDHPAHIVRAVVEAVNNARLLPREEALAREAEIFLEVARSRDRT